MENALFNSKVRRANRQTPRCGRGAEKQADRRTDGTGRNGFLSHSFLPIWGFDIPNWRRSEATFFASLKNLCSLYQLSEPDVSGLCFPQNVSEAYRIISPQVNKEKGIECYILSDGKHPPSLATASRYDTGHTLYYIPVRPLWQIAQSSKLQPLSSLLFQVYAYLYQTIKVSYFTGSSYLAQEYETIENWINEEQDEEEDEWRNEQRSELEIMQSVGATVLARIRHPFKIGELQNQLENYRSTGIWDTEIDEVATGFLQLALDYPKRSIRDSMKVSLEAEEEDRIYIEQYLSFYWSGNDSLADTLFDMVNGHLQEMGYIEEPMSFQWFDSPQQNEHHCFDFEQRLFRMVIKLTELLNDYDNEELKPCVQ